MGPPRLAAVVTDCDCGAPPEGSHRRDCALIIKALAKPKRGAPSEPVTWKRIGTPRVCSRCGRKLKLKDVIEFGTRYTDGIQERYVYCDCLHPPE